MRSSLVLATASLVAALGSFASAASVPFGTATGGVDVYYNGTGPEIPANQAYLRTQVSQTNTNGGPFNWGANSGPVNVTVSPGTPSTTGGPTNSS